MRFIVPTIPTAPSGVMTGVITTLSLNAIGDMIIPTAATNTVSGGVNWPTANRGYFIPFEVPSVVVVKQIFWFNGSVVNGNVDAGIFDLSGNLIVSTGATLQSGVSALQTVNITDTALTPGVYYMGMSLSTGGAGAGRISNWQAPVVQVAVAFGVQQMSSAHPLPNPVTYANISDAYYPYLGLALRATV